MTSKTLQTTLEQLGVTTPNGWAVDASAAGQAGGIGELALALTLALSGKSAMPRALAPQHVTTVKAVSVTEAEGCPVALVVGQTVRPAPALAWGNEVCVGMNHDDPETVAVALAPGAGVVLRDVDGKSTVVARDEQGRYQVAAAAMEHRSVIEDLEGGDSGYILAVGFEPEVAEALAALEQSGGAFGEAAALGAVLRHGAGVIDGDIEAVARRAVRGEKQRYQHEVEEALRWRATDAWQLALRAELGSRARAWNERLTAEASTGGQLSPELARDREWIEAANMCLGLLHHDTPLREVAAAALLRPEAAELCGRVALAGERDVVLGKLSPTFDWWWVGA